MNSFYTLLSALYIFAIFFLADSPVVTQIIIFNPYSLLHIPVYGVLTALLIIAIGSPQKANSRARAILAALIALGIGVLDEINQSFIPFREASVTDIFLDALGVGLAFLLCQRAHPLFWTSPSERPQEEGRIGCPRRRDIKMERRRL